MSRSSPRFIPPNSVVEITASTVGGRYLLRPSLELNLGILACIGRALALYPVDLHAVTFMSNHWHALVSVPDALALVRFVQHVHANVARLVHRLHGWDGSVFGRAAFIVVEAGGQEDRLKYVLAQGVKEGLVRRCVDWPGVHCSRALLLEEVLVGRWPERRRWRQITGGGGKGGGREPRPGEVETVYPIELAPLPVWRELDVAERLQRVRRMVGEIEAAARTKYETVSGAKSVMARDPWSKPVDRKLKKPPHVHTSHDDERARFIVAEIGFLNTFRVARQRVRRSIPALLPPGCFAPSPPFHRTSSAFWSIASRLPRDG